MYGELKDRGFAVLGFPCNDFGGQEPGGPAEIQKCASGYKATFPIFEKIAIKGKDPSPVYATLIAQSKETPSWNFCKYLVGKDALNQRPALTDLAMQDVRARAERRGHRHVLAAERRRKRRRARRRTATTRSAEAAAAAGKSATRAEGKVVVPGNPAQPPAL